MMSKTGVPIYQVKITLKHSKPPIWRRLFISSEITLAQLHDIIQMAMGWYDSHLHMFRIHNENYSIPYDEDHLIELDARDSRRMKLSKLITAEGEKFAYEYDFGDFWEHDILIEKILPPDPKQKLPVCIKGKRACPPEDVGGVWGYDTFLEAIKDPQHPEHEMYTEWIDGEFDPEAFDLDAINSALRSLK
jgi:hypothetical protein